MAPIQELIVSALIRWRKCRAVVCPWCRWLAGVKNGGYRRYGPKDEVLTRIQRYLCRNPGCPAVTFSVLPVGWLPVVRMTMELVFSLLAIAETSSIRSGAAQAKCERATYRRRLGLGKRLLAWFEDMWSAVAQSESWAQVSQLILRAVWPERIRGTNHQHDMASSR